MISKVCSGLSVGALLISVNVSAQDYLPVLQYHHVSASTPASTSLSPEQFSKQMAYLKSAGFQVVDLKSALEKIKADQSLPDKAVAITFDDGYRDIYQNGFPILKQYGYPFTVFVNTLPLQQKNKHFLTWDLMKEMERSGAVFANHTVSHPYMARQKEGETKAQWHQRIEGEVSEVEEALIQHLGSSPKMLAYPYGESNTLIRTMVKEKGIMAFGQQSGVVSADSNFEDLPRFPASGRFSGLKTLKVKLNSMPMPVKSVSSEDYAGNQPVSMTMTFKPGKYRLKDLTCYVSGQGKANMDWVSKHEVHVRAKKPFNVGRGRINCTMPNNSAQQYYWFSNVWIRPGKAQHYVIEKS